MKRNISLAIVTTLMLVMVTLFSSDNTTHAQNQMRLAADSGVITLGPNQVLRVTVNAGDGNDAVRVRFRQMQYIEQGNIYKIASQTLSPPITLAPDEAAVVDGADLAVWRTQVMSNRRNVKVTGIVFDTSTQRVVTQIIMANTEGDF
jgi:hypothetical protein